MKIELIKATENNAVQIWQMQKTAFSKMLDKYKDFETNPASEPLDKVIARLRQPFTYFYLIKSNCEVVGAIRVVDKKSKEEAKRISPLFILPQHRNKGYAQAAILQAEKIHGSNDWGLSTILQEAGNCHLYEKMGYKKTGEAVKVNSLMTLITYKK